MFTKKSKVFFKKNLGNSWDDLADILDIDTAEKSRWEKGSEPAAIYKHLEERSQLDRLIPALKSEEINRGDLAKMLVLERDKKKATIAEKNAAILEKEAQDMKNSASSGLVGFQPFVMAGGLGTRVIHLSPSGLEKQFWRVFGRQSMLQDVILRLGKYSVFERTGLPIVLSIQKLEKKIRNQIDELASGKLKEVESWYEPKRKGTATAIAYALARSKLENKIEDDSLVGFFPADQHIYLLGNESPIEGRNETHALFRKALTRATTEASNKMSIVLLGSKIYKGEKGTVMGTRYGWIRADSRTHRNTRRVLSFKEKPSEEEILKMTANGDDSFLWNTGIFIAESQVLRKAISLTYPEIYDQLDHAKISSQGKFKCNYKSTIDSVMFDYVLEHIVSDTKKYGITIEVVTVDYDWEDLGSEDTIRDHYLRRKNMWPDVDSVESFEGYGEKVDFMIEIGDVEDSDSTYLVYQLKDSSDIQVVKLTRNPKTN